MLDSSSAYYKQSQQLNLHSPYEEQILKNAEFSIKMRETGKMGTIIGSIAFAASFVFNYNPTVSLIITSISAASWLGFHKLAQITKREAEDMLETLSVIGNNQNEPQTVMLITSREEFNKAKQRLHKAFTS